MPDAKLWSLSLRSRMVSAIHGRVGRMRVQRSIPPASSSPCSLQDVGAGRRGWRVNPAIGLGRIVWNELNGDG